MNILLENGLILTLDDNDRIIKRGDILIEGSLITKVAKEVKKENYNIEKIIDCQGKLIMPGLINAHLHSDENFFRGKFDNMPLELWMLFSCPPIVKDNLLNKRMIYLRTMLGAIEMIKNGITSLQDDVSQYFFPEEFLYDQVFQAYKDAGLRSNIALNLTNKEYFKTIPYLEESLPQDLKKMLSASNDEKKLIELYKRIIDKWNDRDLTKVVLSYSAPQRCSKKYIKELYKISEEFALPLHTHVLETKTQRITGEKFYKKSIIKFLAEFNLLKPNLSIVHSVWVDEEDIDLISKHGTSVIHNPISNLKLGSGIMPYIPLQDKGINVALGTDGSSSNDSLNIFESMKFAALIHNITSSKYDKWPDSSMVLNMVTKNSAVSLDRKNEIGCIESGKKADIIILNLENTNFTPLNNLKNQLVYCEDGNSVETVVVNGELIMEEKNILKFDEKKILKEINENLNGFWQKYDDVMNNNRELVSYLDKIYNMCLGSDKNLNLFLN